jgi:hypothetical protein
MGIFDQIQEVFFRVSLTVMHQKQGSTMTPAISMFDHLNTEEVLEIYKANDWSSVDKPIQLMAAPAFCKVVVASAVFFMPLFSMPVVPFLG